MIIERIKQLHADNFLSASDITKGLNYYRGYIRYQGRKGGFDGSISLLFDVESESSYDIYKVKIKLKNQVTEAVSCSCPMFRRTNSCKHLAATFIYGYNEIIKNSLSDEQIAENILSLFYQERKEKRNYHRELKLNIAMTFGHGYEGPIVSLDMKIGWNKMYNLNNKIRKFYDVYSGNSESLFFGKEFTYNRTDYYFNDKDKKLLDFLQIVKSMNENNYYRGQNALLTLQGKNIEDFFKLMDDREYVIYEFGTFYGVRRENPYNISLTKKGNDYHFTIDYSKNIHNLNNRYVIKDNELYEVPNEILKLKSAMRDYDLDTLVFPEEKLEKFSKGLLKEVKDTIKLDDTVKDSVIITAHPSAKIYFDFHYDRIVCNIKLLYRDKEIEYFDKTPDILRDTDYEDEIIDTLLMYGFKVEDNSIYLDDIDDIGIFFEENLDKIGQKYEVYTSQKMKETSVKKNISVISSFGIGQDNIMTYKFAIDGINNDEIVNVLDEIKRKRKYYRLKSGDIINLSENNSLEELNGLIDNMNLDDSSIREGNGIIPKYKAIYLDSLKDRYSIIKTDNLFDKLIENFKSYRDCSLDVSLKDKKILRDYQLVGVKWLYNIYKCGFGGILADEMGLGKSIQTICFLKEVLKEKKDAKILIIAPTSLIYNWKHEFDKFGSELKYKVIGETKAKRKKELEELDDTNILITTYGLIREDHEIYENINFEVIVIDEAQNIKNNNAQMTKIIKKLNSNAKFALTGTPLENSVLELWSIFDFIMPGYLASLLNFQRKYVIRDIDEESIKKLDTLKEQIRPFILRRKKKDVTPDLPDKIENNIYLELTDEQKKLYVAELEKTKRELDELLETEGFVKARFQILKLLGKLRQICIDPSIIYENYKGGSVKINELVPLMKQIIANGHKVLLFSSYKTAIDIVNRELTNNDISCYVIDGSVSSKKRIELVNNFNSDDTNVFLITLKAGGTGLNLTSADVVIHLDLWWNPQVENQATDRAHRIGQKNSVEVIKLVCKGTIEERILELQEKKKVLSDNLIEGEDVDQNIISKLTEKDIKRLLSMDNEDI